MTRPSLTRHVRRPGTHRAIGVPHCSDRTRRRCGTSHAPTRTLVTKPMMLAIGRAIVANFATVSSSDGAWG